MLSGCDAGVVDAGRSGGEVSVSSDALTARFDLLADTRAAGQARRLVSELLVAWERAEDAEVARLLISEVVTNAVRFAGRLSALRLALVAHPDRVRFLVGDGSPLHPVLRSADSAAESGRGIHLVAALASAWGVLEASEESGLGKQVWFELTTAIRTT
jgi:anti-sigma regulatory factor (Ser/Thr protein kinase)